MFTLNKAEKAREVAKGDRQRNIARLRYVRAPWFEWHGLVGILWMLVLLFVAIPVSAREVAITIDDLPRGGDGGPKGLDHLRLMTDQLLKPFKAEQIPVIGFVNEGRIPEIGTEGLRQLLDLWLSAGSDLASSLARTIWPRGVTVFPR